MKIFANKKEKIESGYLIEIGKDYLYLACIKRQKDKYRVCDYKSFNALNGSKEDDLWSFLEKTLEELSTQGIKKAHLLISPNHIISCAKALPAMPFKDALSYCTQVVTHEIGANTSEYYIDHRIKNSTDGALTVGMVAGIKKEVLDKALNILTKYDIEVETIETSITAVENVFPGLGLVPQNDSAIVLRLEEGYSEFFALKESYVLSYDTTAFGFRDIRNSLVRTVYAQSFPIEINIEEAGNILADVGYPSQEGSYERRKKQQLDILSKVGYQEDADKSSIIPYQQLRILLSPGLEVLREKLNAFIGTYKKNSPSAHLSGIYLIGKGSQMKGLGEFLEEKTSIPYLYLDALDLSQKFEPSASLSKDAVTSLTLLLSPLYAASKAYNFFPAHYKIKKETHKAKGKIFLYFFGLIVILLLLYLGIKTNVYYLRKVSNESKRMYAELSPLLGKVILANKLTQELSEFEANISKLYLEYPDWIGILKELSSLTPQEIVLNKIESQINQKGNLLLLRGDVITDIGSLNFILNQFIQNLEGSAYFKELKLMNSKQEIAGYKDSLYFELSCLLN